MKLSDLLATCGNGMRRIEPDRHQQRPHLGLEEARHPARARPSLRSAWLTMRMPLRRERRHHLVVEDRVLLVDQRMRGGGERLDVGARRRPVPGRREASRLSAKRTSKNSSRFDETMQT